MPDYTPNQAGMAEFLNSGMLQRVVRDKAEEIMVVAISLSPIGDIKEGDTHPGLYISSWHVKDHRFGGIHGDRVEAILYNDAPDAKWVEYGHSGREPYHVLRRAVALAGHRLRPR